MTATTQRSSRARTVPVDRVALERELRAAISGEVRFDRLFRQLYSTDASLYRIEPLGVVVPRTREDAVAAVRICASHGAPITPRGGGTGLAGQSVGPGVQIDFSKYMDKVLNIDADQRCARVEPGVILDNFNEALKPHGLQFGPDVATSSRATLGGIIANNSSGARSTLYGITRTHVRWLDVVLSDGSVCRLEPLAGEALARKQALQTLEGQLYRELPALARANADEIERRFPKILRRVSGYNLDALTDPERPVNLAELVIGSEGTLALVLEAEVDLVPLPNARGLLLGEFAGLFEALDATVPALAHKPAAVELVDKLILDQTRDSVELAPARAMLKTDPGSVLIIEAYGNSQEEVEQKLSDIAESLRAQGHGQAFTPALTSAEQQKVWALRKAGLGLLMGLRGDPKPYAWVEDTAVPPERLAEYGRRFHAIVAEEGTHAGWYGHASVGCLHIRPVVNLKTAEGRVQMRRIAERISDLVLEMGGAFAAEHGDGLVRGWAVPKMFGPQLYEAFRTVKYTFDPHNLFNPGKIVDVPDLLDHLRVLPDADLIPSEPMRIDFSADGGFYRAVEMCSGVGNCRKTLTGAMCPTYMATRDEAHSTRGRANALRAGLEGRLPGGLTDDDIHQVMDLCLSCKACQSECPSSVDMTRLKAAWLDRYQQVKGLSLRSWLFSRIDVFSRMGSLFAPLANFSLNLRPARWLNERILGIDHERALPRYVFRTFRRRWRKHVPGALAGQRGEVVLWPDCWINHHEPHVGEALVKLLEAAGYRVIVPEDVHCCGRPALSKGVLGRAARLAERNIPILLEHVRAGRTIVGIEPSCILTMRDEYPDLVSGELKSQAREVAAHAQLFDEFLSALPDDALRFGPAGGKVICHGHCHEKAQVGMEPLKKVLARLPETDVEVLDTGCCGLAGSFGYEVEHREISRACAERRLAPAVRQAEQQDVILAPGFSCRHQIAHTTGRNAEHPVVALARLLR